MAIISAAIDTQKPVTGVRVGMRCCLCVRRIDDPAQQDQTQHAEKYESLVMIYVD